MKIIIGVDGSPGSHLAVREVAARTRPEDTEVRLVTSVDPLHMYAMPPNDKFAFAKAVHPVARETLYTAGLQVASDPGGGP